MLTNRARSDGEWSTTIAPKAKMNFVPTGVGKFGFVVLAGGSFDALTGDNLTRVRGDPGDVSGYPRTCGSISMAAGCGTASPTGIICSMAQALTGSSPTRCNGPSRRSARRASPMTPSAIRPRFQTGLRYRPNEIFSVDLIYGHNITGENANWITIGTTIRFPVPGGKPDHQRTGHL